VAVIAPPRVVPRLVEAPGGPVTLFVSDDPDRDLDEAIAAGAPAPYGRVLWSSAPCVARVLAERSLAGRRVLELGCGTGLASLVAARSGARVLATDVDEGALASVALGARALGVALETAIFDVRGPAPLPPADIVVIADLLYEELLAAAVARRAGEALRAGAQVILGDPGRTFRGAFSSLLESAGYPALFTPVTAGAYKADVAVLTGGAAPPRGA
jgi:predicted nicotinamide N-methyase